MDVLLISYLIEILHSMLYYRVNVVTPSDENRAAQSNVHCPKHPTTIGNCKMYTSSQGKTAVDLSNTVYVRLNKVWKQNLAALSMD